MTTKNEAVVTPDVAETFDSKEVTRVFGALRAEVSMLVQDARRKAPYFAKSKAEAVAKRDAAVRVLMEFAERLDALKKQ